MSSTTSKKALLSSSNQRHSLHDYQNQAIQFIHDVPKCALWLDMGLGKTVSTLTAVTDLMDQFSISKTLVIAPLRVALKVWPQETVKWGHTAHLSYTIIRGTPADRMGQLMRKTDIHVINRELVPWLVEKLGKKWPYDMVVIDESSSFKSQKSKRFKALRKVAPKIERIVELSGTPTSTGLLDLWAQIYLLDGGERLGRTFTKFRDTYFESDYMGFKFTLRPGAEEKIHARLADICMSMSAHEYIDMPERIDNQLMVDMPPAAVAQYRKLEKEFLLELEDDTIVAPNAAVLTGKLLQCANGALYTGEDGEWAEIHSAKLDALEEIVDSMSGAPLLVAYSYKSDLARIKARFKHAIEIREMDDAIEKWNAGEIQMLLAHPASAGHGLNLQEGGSTIAWFGMNWSLELYQQFNARLHRQGQQDTVFVHHILAEGTVDETVARALEARATSQHDLLEAVRADVSQRLA